MAMTLTQLRANLYQVIDESIKKNKPISIERHGKIIKFVPVQEKQYDLFDNLEPHPGTIIGDPEDLVHMDWSIYWNASIFQAPLLTKDQHILKHYSKAVWE